MQSRYRIVFLLFAYHLSLFDNQEKQRGPWKKTTFAECFPIRKMMDEIFDQ